MVTLLLLLVALTLQTPAQPRTTAATEVKAAPFVVGVLRRDGSVNPFAAFDGKRWTSPWPTDVRFLELPIGIEGIPGKWWGKAGPVSEMTAWVDGVNRGPLHFSRPAILQLMCTSRLGLVSDYHSEQPVPLPVVQPYPKDGLAVSGNQRVGAIDVMSAQSPEWAATGDFLMEEFDEAEHTAIRAFTDWSDPIPRSVRRKTPVHLEAIYRAPMDQRGWVAYYVEAVKQYEPGPDDDGCGLVTSANGWVIVGPDGRRSTKLTAHVTYCDRRGVTYMLPLGLINADGRSYWAFQLSGYGREGYLVGRPTTKGFEVQVQYPAGNCPLR